MRSDRSAAGFIAGPGDVLWLSGSDGLAFLERMSTNRLTDLSPGQGRATAILHDNGRVVDLVYAFAGTDGTALITSGPGASAVVTAHLKRYVMYHDQVRVTDAAGQVAVWRLLGPSATALAAKLLGTRAAELASGSWRRVAAPNGEIWALAHPDLAGLGGVDLVAARGPDAESLRASLITAGARPLTDDDYAVARIAAGLPAFGHEIDDLGNPLELGLRDVVDFAKGCYIGQEIVARLDAYDKVQRRLVRLTADGPLPLGAVLSPLTAPPPSARRAAVGRVTTAAPTASGSSWQALALVPQAWAPFTAVQVVAVNAESAAVLAVIDN